MPNQKYLCMYRSPATPSQAPSPKPQASPAQMQEMFAAFQAWQEKFKDNILNMGDQLKSTGKVIGASGVSDGPYVESKEIIAGYMILTAADYAEAVAVVQAMPNMQSPGATIEIREMAGR
jgi:hypothetical protein